MVEFGFLDVEMASIAVKQHLRFNSGSLDHPDGSLVISSFSKEVNTEYFLIDILKKYIFFSSFVLILILNSVQCIFPLQNSMRWIIFVKSVQQNHSLSAPLPIIPQLKIIFHVTSIMWDCHHDHFHSFRHPYKSISHLKLMKRGNWPRNY